MLISEVFCAQSSLHVASGIQADEYREYLREMFFEMLDQGLSLAAIDPSTGTLRACLIACDYDLQPQFHGELPDKYLAKAALLEHLDGLYRQVRDVAPGSCLLVDMAAVDPCASQAGIYQLLRAEIELVASRAGFKWIVGELSAAATQHVCVEKLRQRVVATVRYADFEYAGEKPFASIADPETIILAEAEVRVC